MQCPQCQAQNAADALSCEECGSRLEATCPSCGEANRLGAKFCKKCGQGLAQAGVAGPVAAPKCRLALLYVAIWQRSSIHTTIGRMTFEDWVALMRPR